MGAVVMIATNTSSGSNHRKNSSMPRRWCPMCERYGCLVHQASSQYVRTQKAAGVLALKDFNWSTIRTNVFQSPSEITRDPWYGSAPLFARPCPVRPRHGFVDSQVVPTVKDARALLNLAQEVDPEAELLIMEYIQAHYNAIWTPGRFVIGPGHDGATSGTNSFTIPLVPNDAWMALFSGYSLLKEARIHAPDVPYFEIVTRNREFWF